MKEDLRIKEEAEMRADSDFYKAFFKGVNLLDFYLDISNRYFLLSTQTDDEELYLNYYYLFLMRHLESQLTYKYLLEKGYSFERSKGWSKKED